MCQWYDQEQDPRKLDRSKPMFLSEVSSHSIVFFIFSKLDNVVFLLQTKIILYASFYENIPFNELNRTLKQQLYST